LFLLHDFVYAKLFYVVLENIDLSLLPKIVNETGWITKLEVTKYEVTEFKETEFEVTEFEEQSSK